MSDVSSTQAHRALLTTYNIIIMKQICAHYAALSAVATRQHSASLSH